MTILAKVSKFSQANQKSPSPSLPSPPSPPTLQSALERKAQAIRAQKTMSFVIKKLLNMLLLFSHDSQFCSS